ncbi:hypothetical protein [Nostoc linckia]|uniref:hypothetical protein n=1 Tax=Nostoc linckia TaxID=92942 RepID=UPI001C557420|nr:hypothetical protein [Nostoc linckia]
MPHAPGDGGMRECGECGGKENLCFPLLPPTPPTPPTLPRKPHAPCPMPHAPCPIPNN